MIQVIIQRVIRANIQCNDQNNDKDPDDLEVKDLDYLEYISRTWLEHYADLIAYPYSAIYEFHEVEAQFIKEAIPSGFLTGRPCTQYKEELDTIAARMELEIPPTPPTGWFVRMSSGSPKDGMKRVGTGLRSAQDIVSQLATSKRTLIGLHSGDRKLYLVPHDPDWQDWRELRVFVRKGKVTAISQYVLDKPGLFSALSDEELTDVGHSVMNYLQSVLPPILDKIGTQDVVCDLYYNPDESFKIIEFNSFGYCFAAGAALFHWQHDRQILYGSDAVYFRVHQ